MNCRISSLPFLDYLHSSATTSQLLLSEVYTSTPAIYASTSTHSLSNIKILSPTSLHHLPSSVLSWYFYNYNVLCHDWKLFLIFPIFFNSALYMHVSSSQNVSLSQNLPARCTFVDVCESIFHMLPTGIICLSLLRIWMNPLFRRTDADIIPENPVRLALCLKESFHVLHRFQFKRIKNKIYSRSI